MYYIITILLILSACFITYSIIKSCATEYKYTTLEILRDYEMDDVYYY